MARLNLGIRVVNVPENLPHEARSREILRLPEFLRVNMDTAPGLAMVNYGTETPPIDQTDMPWFKRHGDGTPLGIFVFHNGKWKTATPMHLTGPTAELVVKYGQATVTRNVAANSRQEHDIATFTPAFVALPFVSVTLAGGTVCDNEPDTADDYSFVFWPTVTVDSLRINTRFLVDCSGAPQTFVFNWMVVGTEKPL